MRSGRGKKKEKLLKKEYNQEFKDPTTIAIVTTMMPISIQEYVYTNIRKDESYKSMIDKVKLLVSDKVVSSGPAPMDLSVIGNDSGDHSSAGHYDDWGNWYEEQVVEAVGMHMQCHGCGGWVTCGGSAQTRRANQRESRKEEKRIKAREEARRRDIQDQAKVED